MDVFGNTQNQSKSETVVTTSGEISEVGLREFIETAENSGIEEVYVSDLNGSELEEFLKTTPCIFLSPKKIECELDFIPIGGDV